MLHTLTLLLEMYAMLAAVNTHAGTAAIDSGSVRKFPGGIGTLRALSSDARNAKKEELGRYLFFDTRLSGDRQTSCGSCHQPKKGFSDGRRTAIGFQGKVLARHTPTVLNAAYNSAQFWDGRATTLEEQAVGPITARDEMNLPDEKELVARLNEVSRYRQLFAEVFGSGPSRVRVGEAIAAYERTLTTGNSRFDRFALGDASALNDSEQRGLLLFVGKASCTQCHRGPNFTDNRFYNIGLRSAHEPDLGRYAVTNDAADRGAFKTPTLRNIALTAPFMHDGSLETLEEVVDFYDRGGDSVAGKSDRMVRLELTKEEKHDLIAFLETLTGSISATAPERLQ